MTNLSTLYAQKIADGDLRPDPAQEAVLPQFDRISAGLQAEPVKRGLFRRASPAPAPKGLYLWGGVGRGKSMLMDLFVDSLGDIPSRRVHFHAFMQEIHTKMHAARQEGVQDALAPVAQEVAASVRVLAFDEMQISDITDAMIVGRLFEALFEADVCVVTTSNRLPDELYKNGLHRDRFLPFIEVLKARCQILAISDGQDWRASMLAELPAWYVPDDARATAALDDAFARLTSSGEVTSEVIRVAGRDIQFDAVSGDVARVSFAALCVTPLAARDYLAIASRFAGLVIDHVPTFDDAAEASARRFMWLIDALYDRQRFLIASSVAPIEDLYGGFHFKFEFDRTCSRLSEMTRRVT